jgi:hypothetical protein
MNPNECRSISDGRVFVNCALIAFCSVTQIFVMLSVTEAKIAVGHAVFVLFVGVARAQS